MSDEPRLLAETSGAVITLTLDNPSRGNALTRPIYEQLNEAYRRIAEDPSIRVVVFTAAGDRHFCTGADVSALGGLKSTNLLKFGAPRRAPPCCRARPRTG